MKIVLAPFGSRGDVEPLLALATVLRSRGHRVTVCAPSNFSDAVDARGMEFVSAGRDFRDIFDGTQSDSAVFHGALKETRAQFDALMIAAEGADIILGSALQFAAPTVAEMRGIPYLYAVFSPMYLRSVQLPTFGAGSRTFPPFLRRVFWFVEDALRRRSAGWLAKKRRSHGMSGINSLHLHLLGRQPALGAFDPVLAPLPGDALPTTVTGYWRASTGGALPQAVADFLARGARPVYVGFGSMRYRDSGSVLPQIVRNLLRDGHRVVAARGWSGFSGELEGGDCLVVDDVPHDLVLPGVAAVIHHGGAGTTTAAALAGVPQIVVPHLGDQFHHARRVEVLGLGPPAIPLRSDAPRAAAAAVRSVVGDAQMAARAREFSVAMATREGSEFTAELLERATS